MVEIGHGGVGFAFDSEGPRHRVLTEPFRLADRLMTNAEWMEFIEDGGYTKPLLRCRRAGRKPPPRSGRGRSTGRPATASTGRRR